MNKTNLPTQIDEGLPVESTTKTDLNYFRKVVCRIWNNSKFISQSPYVKTGCLVSTRPRRKAGYQMIYLNGDCFLVHRVQFQLAYGPPSMDLIRHLCNCPNCYNPIHLAEGTAQDNRNDAVKAGRTPKGDRSGRRKHPERYPIGEDCHSTKLTEKQVEEIMIKYSNGLATSTELAKEYQICSTHVSGILRGEKWKSVHQRLGIKPDIKNIHRENIRKKRLKYNNDMAKEFKRRWEAGELLEKIASDYGLCRTTIYNAIQKVKDDDLSKPS